MIRKSIVNIWRDAPAEKISGMELVDLLIDRFERVTLQLMTKPIVALDPADFTDFIIVSKVDYYREHGGGCTYDFDDTPETRKQVVHVIKSRYAIDPDAFLSGSLDQLAREIARRIEGALDDQMWEAA